MQQPHHLIEAVHCDEAWLAGDGNLDFSKIVVL